MTIVQRQIAAACLIGIAALGWLLSGSRDSAPHPGPQPPAGLVLRGLFVGPTASEDAVLLSGFTASLADYVEHDGTLADPRLKTGVAIDDLRVAAREARMKGESLGARQPKVRNAIHVYLDNVVGDDGGPLTAEERATWVSAFRDISRAAADAAK